LSEEEILLSHSEELVTKVLKPWITKDDVLKEALGHVGYQGQIHAYYPRQPNLDFFNQLEQHLKTGYKEIWVQWEITLAFSKSLIDSIIDIFEKFNKMIVNVIDTSGLPFIKFDNDSQMPCYYPDLISYVVYLEIMRKNKTKNPLGMFTIIEKELRYDDQLLAKSSELEKLHKLLELVYSLINNSIIFEIIKSIWDIEQKIHQNNKLYDFKEEIKKIIKNIEINNEIISGSCDKCRTVLKEKFSS
jgi:hypothetical protein